MSDDDDINHLQRLDELLSEFEQTTEKLKLYAKDPEATAQASLRQMADLTSLTGDSFATLFAEVIAIREYLHQEVEPVIQDGGGSADPSDPSQLMPEDAELFARLISSHRASIMAGLELHDQSEEVSDEDKTKLRTEVQGQVDECDRALSRIGEIVLDPDDEDEDEDDEDDEGDEAPEDSSAVASTEPPPNPDGPPAEVVPLPKKEDEST